MTRKLLRSSVLCLLLVSLVSTAWAEDIYVKNKLYSGQVFGQGMSAEISINELAAGLGVEPVSDNGYWKLGEVRVPGREHDGEFFVFLRDLKDAGMTVMHSPELGTIDISMPKGQKKTAKSPDSKRKAAESWGGANKPTLVYFGADW